MKSVLRTNVYLVVSLVLAMSFPLVSLAGLSAVTPRKRQFEFAYTATVKDIPRGANTVDLWVPVPHDDPFQTITDLQIEAPSPYQIHTAQYGNRILHVSVEHPQQASLTVTLRFHVVRTEHIQQRLYQVGLAPTPEERDPDILRWLQPDRLVPIDGQIKQWAQEVVEAAGAKTDLEKARAIYNHVIATVKYDKSGQGWGRGDIFSPAGAHVARGDDWTQAGPALDLKSLVRLDLDSAKIDERGLHGEVIATDGPFGNLVTNVNAEDFLKLGYQRGQTVPLTIGERKIDLPFVKTFSDVPLKKPLIYIDSRGHLGLAVNQGSFAAVYGVEVPIKFTIPRAK